MDKSGDRSARVLGFVLNLGRRVALVIESLYLTSLYQSKLLSSDL